MKLLHLRLDIMLVDHPVYINMCSPHSIQKTSLFCLHLPFDSQRIRYYRSEEEQYLLLIFGGSSPYGALSFSLLLQQNRADHNHKSFPYAVILASCSSDAQGFEIALHQAGHLRPIKALDTDPVALSDIYGVRIATTKSELRYAKLGSSLQRSVYGTNTLPISITIELFERRNLTTTLQQPRALLWK
jgi:hypothetical protein